MHIWCNLISLKPSVFDMRHRSFKWTCSLTANSNVTQLPQVLPTRFLEWVNTLKHPESCSTFISAPRLLCPRGDAAATLCYPTGSCGGLEGSWLLLWLQWEPAESPSNKCEAFYTRLSLRAGRVEGGCWRVCVCRGSAFSRACYRRSVQALFDSLDLGVICHHM